MGKRTRQRGSVDERTCGSLRIRVEAGKDPLTNKRRRASATVAAAPDAGARAEQERARMLNEVDEQRHVRTDATVAQLIDTYLDLHQGAKSTLGAYRGYTRNHIAPLIGRIRAADVDAETLDRLYATLRRCREHCGGHTTITHRVSGKHQCDRQCIRHVCRPLSRSTVRQIHFILSKAFKRAVKWKWITTSPVADADAPELTPPNPDPPCAADAARIVTRAFEDPDWGAFVWLAMTTGLRRGELCALRWRRIVLDDETVTVLTEHWERYCARANELGTDISRDGFVFSVDPRGASPLKPDATTQRYRRQTRALGIDTSLHKLRHFSATELISAGVDVRTVAGRLGHGGGGATTLRVYSAWVSEADQRAAATLQARMPARPSEPVDPLERAKTDPQAPYEKIAAQLRDQIVD